jgi:hypothetical protein
VPNLHHPSVVVPFELIKILFAGSGVGNCVIVDSHYRGWGVTGTWEKCEKNVKPLLAGHWSLTSATLGYHVVNIVFYALFWN